jgi:1,4-dihydroxy-2-naphthoate octaprenyltransferase
MKSLFHVAVQICQPLNLLFVGLSYFLGISAVRYLGISLDTSIMLGGLVLLFAALLTSSILFVFFAPASRQREIIGEGLDILATLRILFYSSLFLLMLSGLIAFWLISASKFSLPSILYIVAYFLLALAISVPPFRLEDKGFGELVRAMLITGFSVLVAFSLQANTVHRMVAYISIPLVTLALASFLTMDFPAYAADQLSGRQSMLVRLTWERAIPVHNALIIFTYLFFLAASYFGIPFRVIWPVLLTVPLAIYQAVMLRNIALGLKPNWRILTINAKALIGIALYLLLFTFWIS